MSTTSESKRFAAFCKLIGLKLEPFQRKIVTEVFSKRREVLVMLPRGNGKSTLLAALALWHLLTTPNAAAYVAAASREQASVLFDICRQLARAHPDVERRVEMTRREMRCGDAFLKVISADAGKQHGLIPSLVIVDELHAHPNDDLYIALRTAMLKVPGAKMVTISTAGIGADSPIGRLRSRALKGKVSRRGAFTRTTAATLAMLEWALPEDADLADAIKSNPASWITKEGLKEQREAVHEIAFRRYHANQWVAAEAPWIDAELWDKCAEEPQMPDGVQVILGVDAAIRHDSAAVATVYREGDIYHAAFEVWTPPPEIQLERVVEHIRDQAERYDVQGVCFDPYFMASPAQRLEAEGIAMVEWRQDNARMVPATQTLHEAVVHGRLRHGGDAIARQHALAAGVRETERGLRIKKTAGSGSNDCVVALAMAVEWASRHEPESRRSVYEERFIAA